MVSRIRLYKAAQPTPKEMEGMLDSCRYRYYCVLLGSVLVLEFSCTAEREIHSEET